MAINFPTNPTVDQTYTSGSTSWMWDGTVWNVLSSGGVGGSTSFNTISVDGEADVVADTSQDTLTIIAGSNVSISTNNITNSITISSSGTGSGSANSFSTISVSGQDNVVANSSTDTLTLAAGSGISISSNANSDTITISNSSAGVTAFTGLSDAAGLTVDKFYLPAITMLTVSNSGASAYRFDQYGTANNPTIYAINGTTIAFNLAATGHPFLIQTPAGQNYNTGLVHVSTAGVVSTGANAQGKDSGTLYWKIPTDVSGGYRYQCSIHAPMVGSISIKTFSTL